LGFSSYAAQQANQQTPWAAKFSLGNYCRQVVAGLFNKNQTLHDLILGKNAPFPNPWHQASLWGPYGQTTINTR